jgi:para-nitrobenzyl esterase
MIPSHPVLRLAAFFVVAVFSVPVASQAQTVTTPGGTFPSQTYQGVSADGVTEFLGIRYAAPPAGDLRWTAPTPPAAVSGTVEATQFGSACPQSVVTAVPQSEDCLFLNLFVPNPPISSNNHFPVMVFIHGGAFVTGVSNGFNGAGLALEGNVVVVTINYRVGILGFLASPALDEQSPTGTSGNYGILDQQFALQWVKQNISAFGGDPEKVTIFGQSAGGFSVCDNVVSPKASGLFARAITESGPCASALTTRREAENLSTPIAADLGCAPTDVACFRAQPVSAILAAQGKIVPQHSLASLSALSPNVDGVVIPRQPLDALATGQFNHVPLIVGTSHDEGRYFIARAFDLSGGPLTAADYPTEVGDVALTAVERGEALSGSSANPNPQLVAEITSEILHEYPLSDFPSPDLALSAVVTDRAFSCQAELTRDVTSLQVPTFGYEFNDENAPMLFLPPVSFPYGATHTDELQFLFPFPGDVLTTGEQDLAAIMKHYWTTFARDGRPKSPGHPWPLFSTLFDDNQSLVPPAPRVEHVFVRYHHCGFWFEVLAQTLLQGTSADLR